MKGMLIPVDGRPMEVAIHPDGHGSHLHALQELVGGDIEPLNVVFGEEVSLYVNDEGLYSCPPNRAVYATRGMEEAGYVSQMDYSTVVREGDPYCILFGDIVAVGFDPETGEDRDLTEAEATTVTDYFTHVSPPDSGMREVRAIQSRIPHEDVNHADGAPSLSETAAESRSASSALSGELEQDRFDKDAHGDR